MVDSTSSSAIASPQPPPPGSGAAPELTRTQTAIVDEVLSGYDPDALTDDDINAINRAFAEAGVTPSSALKSAIEGAGFDPTTLAGSVRQGPPGAPLGQAPASQDMVQALSELLKSYDPDRITEQDVEEIRAKLVAEGFDPPPPGEQLVQIDA